MKDKWIEPFQDKLGDFELDLPAAAPHTPFGRVWPLLSAAAAAAAVLLFLLLRTPAADRPAAPAPVLAETPVRLTAGQPALASAGLLHTQDVRPRHPADPVGTAAASKPAAPKPDAPGFAAYKPAASEPTASEPAVSPAPAVSEEPHPTVLMPDPEQAQTGRGRHAGLSARLHVTPLSVQNFSAGANAGFATFHNIYADMPVASALSYSPSYVTNLAAEKADINADPRRQNDIHCYLPVKTGLTLRWETGPRFWIESGLGYSLHRAAGETVSSALAQYRQEYRMHYIGVPLKAGWQLAGRKQWQVYAAAGGEAELMVGGSLRDQLRSQHLSGHPMLFSLTGGIGAEYNFTRFLGIYAEPGGAWHFKPQGNLPNYYRDHPFSFDFRAGLRFNLHTAR